MLRGTGMATFCPDEEKAEAVYLPLTKQSAADVQNSLDKSAIGEELAQRNSEPSLAGDISIAMGWSSTPKVGVDREADAAPSRAEPLVRTKNNWNPL